jgi:tight adherence protein B
MIQKQIGGNLAEILENISHTIKERIRISDEIKVLTASGRTSGYVIGLLPVLILVFLMIINPSYVEEFFITPRGRTVLFISFVLEFIGFIIVRKIVTVKY